MTVNNDGERYCQEPAELLIAVHFNCGHPQRPTYSFCLPHYQAATAPGRYYICNSCGSKVTISEPVPL